MTGGPHDFDVFINCPFDDGYWPRLKAILFAVQACGFKPRCTMERRDGGTPRIEKIVSIIRECPYGIHDISRTGLDRQYRLPRFNMPFELGLYIGAMRFTTSDPKRQCLVMDRERYRFQKFLSDIAGQDIVEHGNKIDRIMRHVRDFLRSCSGNRSIPSGSAILKDYRAFGRELPRLCRDRRLEARALDYTDLNYLIQGWLEADAQVRVRRR